jgi:hypothetical protein
MSRATVLNELTQRQPWISGSIVPDHIKIELV